MLFSTRPVLEYAISVHASATPSKQVKTVSGRLPASSFALGRPICHAAQMLSCVGYIQEFTNLLRIFRISSLRPASAYLTPIGGDEPKANCNSLSIATKEDREMASTKDVVDHHLQCFGERNLKGASY